MSEVKVKKAKEEGLMRRPMLPDFPWFRGNFFHLNPFALMRQFTEEMDRMFRLPWAEKGIEVWSPAIETKMVEGNLVVKAELPGLKKEDFKVQVSDEELILEGERKEEKVEETDEYYRSERSYGRFYRAIPLPEGAELDKVTAKYTDGLLEITVPCQVKKPALKEVPVQEAAKAKAA